MLPEIPRAAAISIAFLAGVLLTLGFKDIYPDLEANFQRHRAARRRRHGQDRRTSLFWPGVGEPPPVQLEDRDDNDKNNKNYNDKINNNSNKIDTSQISPPPVRVGIEGTIGHTPLIELPSLSRATGRRVLAKVEFLNGAGGSPKDRVALAMIAHAEVHGLLRPGRGDTIYEGTVGSTGIAIAALARARGYRAHVCMPDDQALEKSELLHHLGATVERVPVQPITSPGHYVNVARRRARDHEVARGDGSVGYFANQFENEANVGAHEEGTGPEIVAQTGGELHVFVAGAGTGGTLSGVARHLKLSAANGLTDEARARVKVVLADPQGSGLYHRVRHGVMFSPTEREGTRRRTQVDSVVEGIGINRVVANFEAGRELVDDAVRVTDEQACRMASWLSRREGVFVGSSSAVNCVGAVVAAVRFARPGDTVVTVLCDSGARHLSKFWKKVGELERELEREGGEEEEDLWKALGIPRE